MIQRGQLQLCCTTLLAAVIPIRISVYSTALYISSLRLNLTFQHKFVNNLKEFISNEMSIHYCA
jgi:hypothetical protein